MIDLKAVWVPQVLWYAALVADEDKLASAFNQRPGEIWTSVTGYDELVVQLFEDLDAEGQLEELMKSDLPSELKIKIKDFVEIFDRFDNELENRQPDFASVQWGQVGAAARSVIVASEGWTNH